MAVRIINRVFLQPKFLGFNKGISTKNDLNDEFKRNDYVVAVLGPSAYINNNNYYFNNINNLSRCFRRSNDRPTKFYFGQISLPEQ